MKCIYCLKDERNTRFTTQEHIIPRTIGGIIKLPLGMVCDECNESFSVIEKRFVDDSVISIPKQMIGPAGRHGKFKSNLCPLISTARSKSFAFRRIA